MKTKSARQRDMISRVMSLLGRSRSPAKIRAARANAKKATAARMRKQHEETD